MWGLFPTIMEFDDLLYLLDHNELEVLDIHLVILIPGTSDIMDWLFSMWVEPMVTTRWAGCKDLSYHQPYWITTAISLLTYRPCNKGNQHSLSRFILM